MLPRSLLAAGVAVALFALIADAKADQHCAAACSALVDPEAGQELLCAVPETPEAVAVVTQVAGPVQISVPAGMADAAPQTPVEIGGQLVVLEGGLAELSGPGCVVSLAGPALINVVPANGCACAIGEAEITPLPLVAITAGIGILGATVILMLADDDDPPTPPVTP